MTVPLFKIVLCTIKMAKRVLFLKNNSFDNYYTFKFVFLPKCLGVPPRELLLGVGPKLIIADIFDNSETKIERFFVSS